MPEPRFSIVLPVYNGEHYLRAAIASVLDQTFEDFELLLWDDASTDGSADIIASFDDPRIRSHRNEVNQGLFKTLNAASRSARGTLIRLLGQDDTLKPHCLEAEDAFWTRHPDLGMTYCQRDLVDAEGQVVQPFGTDPTPEIMDGSQIAEISFYYGCMPGNISTVVIRRAVLEDLGFFNEDLAVSGDFELWVRLSEHHPTGFIRQSLLYLRDHSNQLSRQSRSEIQRMIEDRSILDALHSRLPPDSRAHGRRFLRWHRHRTYAHFAMRSLLAGRWKMFQEAYRAIRAADAAPVVFAIWAFTLNGRLFKGLQPEARGPLDGQ